MLIGTDSLITTKPGELWTLTKRLCRKQLINQHLLTQLIMTNYSLIILRRIYLFESVKTHQLLLAPFVQMYSRVTLSREVRFKQCNHAIINRDLLCYWYYSKLCSCSSYSAKSREKVLLLLFGSNSTFILSLHSVQCQCQRSGTAC